ncbi:hypothetical protein ACFSWE_04065 [Leucobacter albus]|uniref:GIY-YIG domain-containing protein n=1 Tax=Leucobacter albus TaxID=272210 RepID=A0ABW3TMM5_9MICO
MNEPTQLELNSNYGYIYEIECLLTGHLYIGKHTPKPNEDWRTYLGSSKALRSDQRYFGKEYFTKRLIEWADSAHDLALKEERAIHALVNSGKQHYNFSSEDGYLYALTPEAARTMTIHRLSYRNLKGLKDQRSLLIDQIVADPTNADIYRERVKLFSDAVEILYFRAELHRAIKEADLRTSAKPEQLKTTTSCARMPKNRHSESTPSWRSDLGY